MMVTGKVYSMHDPQGKLAIRIAEAGPGWSLVLVVTPPSPTLPGLKREDHIFAGDLMVHEARDVESVPVENELATLEHFVYVQN